MKANKEVANVKSSNNKSINSLLIGATTTNTKLIANHFEIVAAKFNEKIVRVKKWFHIILDRLLMKLFLFSNNSSRHRILSMILCLIALFGLIGLNQTKLLDTKTSQQKH